MQLPQGSTAHYSAVVGVHSLINLMNCMPRSLDNQIHETWGTTFHTGEPQDSRGWRVEVQPTMFSSLRWSWLQEIFSRFPRSANTINLSHICAPFSPLGEDSNSTAIPVAVLSHLWLHETWAKGRLKECVRKYWVLLLVSCTFCQFSKSSYLQVCDILLTCAFKLWAFMDVVSSLPNINIFEKVHQCCILWKHYWHWLILA